MKATDFSKFRVLLVEDETSIRAVEKALLKEMGFTDITEAATASEAKTALSKQKFDIVLCDWELPDGEGIDLLSVLRETHDQKVPFIMVTVNAQIEKVKQAISAGVTDYISKPFEQQAFCNRVQIALMKVCKK